jgi:thiol-disulfide isomerase/thioredoxin
VAVLVVTVVALGAGVLAGRSTGSSETDLTTASIDLPLLSDPGRQWSLGAQRGVPQIVNFWASWCTPCRTEMPEIERIVQESNGRIGAVGINIWDQPDAATSLMEELGITYPLVTDPGGNTAAEFEVTALPTTLLVDGDGRVVARATGRPTGEELQQMIADELGLAW